MSHSELTVRVSDLDQKVGQIDTKWDKSWTFSDQISVHFGAVRQNVLKSDLKSPGFVPFRATLAHSGPKSDIPGGNSLDLVYISSV